MICRLNWFLRFIIPTFYIGISLLFLIGLTQTNYTLQHMTFFEWFLVFFWIIGLYFQLSALTAKFVIRNSDLILKYYIFRKRQYPIKDILFIEEKPMFLKFSNSYFGPDYDSLHLKEGKKIIICGLSDQYNFMQLLRSKLSF